MGEGGEIFIFDMGKSVKVLDLAERMVRLSGLEPYVDIDIVFSGLRPGEKIEEELLAKAENIIPTHHHKIMRAKVRKYNFDQVHKEVNELLKLATSQDELKIVGKMKKIVPEYISNNSVFEALDNLDPTPKPVLSKE
jgi:FlaA1/EpsC-like NDP-sugar epimerase